MTRNATLPRRGGGGGRQPPLTRKHCQRLHPDSSPRLQHTGQVSWLPPPARRLLGPQAGGQWRCLPSGTIKMAVYSCATAHDSHVIPSWLPALRQGRPRCISPFKALSHCPMRVSAPPAWRCKDTKKTFPKPKKTQPQATIAPPFAPESAQNQPPTPTRQGHLSALLI